MCRLSHIPACIARQLLDPGADCETAAADCPKKRRCFKTERVLNLSAKKVCYIVRVFLCISILCAQSLPRSCCLPLPWHGPRRAPRMVAAKFSFGPVAGTRSREAQGRPQSGIWDCATAGFLPGRTGRDFLRGGSSTRSTPSLHFSSSSLRILRLVLVSIPSI